VNEPDAVDGQASATVAGPETQARPRIAFASLRERTDELELFISGLLAFALLAVPSRIFDAWAVSSAHVDGLHWQALWFAFSICVGLSYVLGTALVAHLAIRGYWVGLISLKSNFPDGVRWERLTMLGEVSRRIYQKRGLDLDKAIANADRAASVLFSSTLIFTLGMVWIGVLAALLLTTAGIVGNLVGAGDGLMLVLIGVAMAAVLLLSLLPWLLEAHVARVRRKGGQAPRLERWIEVIMGIGGALTLARIGLPVQLVLQSQMGAGRFMAYFAGALMLAVLVGAVPVLNSSMFTVMGRYSVITGQAVDAGMLSAHYESMRSADDRLRRYPMIPADRIDKPTLRLFIPHQPQRDNALARERCSVLEEGRNTAQGPEAARQAVACLQQMWTVTLDGKPVSLTDFVPIERRDLELRGIVGYIRLSGMAPGRHDLALVWNQQGELKGPQRRRSFSIPFWYDVDG